MATKRPGLSERFDEFKETWQTLSAYERFEQVIALVLTYLIAVIILIATWDLAKEVFLLAWHGLLDPLDHRMFQVLFGQIMTVLIALEFKHSIIGVVAHRESIIQAVLLIALLAISRKFIILEPNQYSSQTILALAAVVIALGATYWLIRDREGVSQRSRSRLQDERSGPGTAVAERTVSKDPQRSAAQRFFSQRPALRRRPRCRIPVCGHRVRHRGDLMRGGVSRERHDAGIAR